MEEQYNIILEILNKQQIEINELKEQLSIYKETHKEIYYQKFLEQYFQSSHAVTKYGTTDISTETHHIEIKNWKHYKNALGQLKSYNHTDNKKLIVAFFGEYKNKDKVIELFHANDINVWELIKAPEKIEIIKHEKENNLIFVEKYIKKHENGFIKWTDMWKLYQEWYYKINGNTNNLKKLATKKYFIDKIFKIEDKMYKNKGRGWVDFSMIEI